MHIVVIEPNFQQRESLITALSGYLKAKGIQIISFSSVYEVLCNLDRISRADLLIIEKYIAFDAPNELLKERKEFAIKQFPEVVKDFHPRYAGERIIRTLRQRGAKMPVIVYTVSDEKDVDPEVLNDPNVHFCQKALRLQSILLLSEAITP